MHKVLISDIERYGSKEALLEKLRTIGDNSFTVEETQDGILILTENSQLAEQLRLGLEMMDKHEDTFKRLAK